MDLVHELCPLQLLEVTKKSDNLSGWMTSIQHLAHIWWLFIQGTRPGTFDNLYKATVDYLAKEHLIIDSKEIMFAKICFLKSHPTLNKHLIDAAITKSILLRDDFSNDILNPIEVRYFLFFVNTLKL